MLSFKNDRKYEYLTTYLYQPQILLTENVQQKFKIVNYFSVVFFPSYKGRNPPLFGFQNFGGPKNFRKYLFFVFFFALFLSKKSFIFPFSENPKIKGKTLDYLRAPRAIKNITCHMVPGRILYLLKQNL